MISMRCLAISAVTALGLTLAAPVVAQTKDERGHEHKQGHDEAKEHSDAQSLGSVKEAWALLVAKMAESETHIASKKLEEVDVIGHDLENVVKTLEEKSDMVAADKKANLASAIKQLDKAIEGMHHAAEEGDASHAAAEHKKITSLMPLIEGLYPPGALK